MAGAPRSINRRNALGVMAAGVLAVGVGFPMIVRANTIARDGAQSFKHWLGLLTPTQMREAYLPFAEPERFNWHYVPRSRRGLALKDMSEQQRDAAFTAIASGLSNAGQSKVQDIIRLEEILGQIETFGFFRDPENYVLAVFGSPEADGRWGWRFEGHHLSVNMTYAEGRLIGMTPLFLGANPAIVPVGHLQGLEVMGAEIAAARDVLGSLDGRRRGTAIISERSFGDIVAGPGRETELSQAEGLAASDMTADQRERLLQLIDRFVRHIPETIQRSEMDRIRAGGVDGIHFAWAGSVDPGPGNGHYFRVHGPTVLIEYDNTRSDANHVHSVWLDPANAFGRNALGAHYEQEHGRSVA